MLIALNQKKKKMKEKERKHLWIMKSVFPFWNIQINLLENWKFLEAYYSILGYYWKGMWWLFCFIFFFVFTEIHLIYNVYICVYIHIYTDTYIWVLRWHNSKRFICQCRRRKSCGFDPWVRKIPWSRKWKPGPVFLPGQFHRQRSLVGYSPWGHTESDVTEHMNMCIYIYIYTFSNSFPW